MLYSEVIAVCSQIRTKHINTVCGRMWNFLLLQLVVRKSNQQALNGRDV